MTLRFADGAPFARGACRYFAHEAAKGNTLIRPFLDILVEGQPIEAAVDTGGFFLILKPGIGELLQLKPEDGLFFDELRIRGGSHGGHLHRVTMTLEAERGETFDAEVTAFVPVGFWDFPNFLGWPMCLERFRFAFEPDPQDPSNGWFHFGPLDEV